MAQVCKGLAVRGAALVWARTAGGTAVISLAALFDRPCGLRRSDDRGRSSIAVGNAQGMVPGRLLGSHRVRGRLRELAHQGGREQRVAVRPDRPDRVTFDAREAGGGRDAR